MARMFWRGRGGIRELRHGVVRKEERERERERERES
jgi:hypothetical protein